MTATIIANIPARNVLSPSGKTIKYQAHTDIFYQDEAGRWTIDFCGTREPVFEAEVIDKCTKATNWPEIKAVHFPMYGFHK